jgi:hypothetical protein
MYILVALALIIGGGLMVNKCTFNSQIPMAIQIK